MVVKVAFPLWKSCIHKGSKLLHRLVYTPLLLYFPLCYFGHRLGCLEEVGLLPGTFLGFFA